MSKSTDPISDLLTAIRNGQSARHGVVRVPASKVKLAIAQQLSKFGYVGDVKKVDEGPQGLVEIELRYDNDGRALITNIQRESKPSRRVYVGVGEIPRVLNGLGLAILSTSRGVISDREAKANNVGGEILCTVY